MDLILKKTFVLFVILVSVVQLNGQNKKNIYKQALDKIEQYDTLILKYTEDNYINLFEICPQTDENIGLTSDTYNKKRKYFSKKGLTTTTKYALSKGLSNQKYLKFNSIDDVIAIFQDTLDANWLVFSKYNKKYRLLEADLYLDNIGAMKKVHPISVSHNKHIKFNFFFSKCGKLKEVNYSLYY